jgi:transcriptional regulator with XRE-family HTH domain
MFENPNAFSLSKDPAGIGGRVINARVRKNITLRQLSEMSGVKAINISAIETGNMNYSLYDLDRVRKALGLSLSHVLDGEGNAMIENDTSDVRCLECKHSENDYLDYWKCKLRSISVEPYVEEPCELFEEEK